MVKCPSCTKKYSFCRCFECQKLIFSEENQYILGTSVICQECSKYSVNTVCPGCGTKISFLDRIDDMINGEKIHCSKCEKEFQYFTKGIEMTDEKEIYSQNLIALSEIIKGERVQFGKNTIDENYKYFENSLINELYEEDSKDNKSQLTLNKKSNLCSICHCNKKESVFYPCGHRCTCYKCAVYYFNRYLDPIENISKCPRCNEKAFAIVPKIYEQFNDIDAKELIIENKENK